ncbi:polysaccharide biosynthesis/export family protein [Chryseobacterium gotjawalense]|uniref:Polysaccharide biosynthesis/export family protein n=1 Tax=Chryseobacterium gotjawalense TaxID=3042315 RepID=A0ABY8RGG9_9FLAO|nr:polysaccharide biosynthesis/export family protein [Chryseobacterium sp. wdc7]WHF53066.1 polysaccharide biosynthesis/export family protein [Chryseobacterium sp. wdc7]
MKYLIYLFSFSLLCSCGIFPRKSVDDGLNYLNNIDSVALKASQNASLSTIQPGDQLVIVVSAKDQDVVRPFNQNFSSGQLVEEALAGGNSRPQPTPVAGPTYMVDSQGNIDFPIIGTLNTDGKTLEAFKGVLKRAISRYIKEPVVSIRNTNYKVTVLGEVNKPGQYIIPDGNATLLNALGLAGDLTIYGKRNDVLLVRNVDGITTKERIDLSKADFINSPYYYLRQGDVIYVSPNKTKEKTARLDPNAGLYISIASIAITIIALIIRK